MSKPAPVIPPYIPPSNIIPAWVLIFWRLYRGKANGDYAAAWTMLPAHLPRGVRRPSKEIAVQILLNHKLI